MRTLAFTTVSAEKTRELGARIGAACAGGEVFLLSGDLGAGKTCLTQGVARGLGVEATVTSPTFVTHMQYLGGRGLALEHFDFYRLEGCRADALDFTISSTTPGASAWSSGRRSSPTSSPRSSSGWN